MTATKKYIPGKRIKSKHRKSVGQPLKAYARFLAQDQNEDEKSKKVARDWLSGKGVRL